MSNEISMNVGLVAQKVDPTTGIRIVNSNFSGQNKVDLTGNSGPYVGTISVPTTGVAVDLSAVGTPGAGWLFNQDPVNSVDWGTRDDATGKFTPSQQLLPGMGMPIYLSPHLGIEESGAGSTGVATAHLFFKAYGGTVKVDVEIFPK